ncbi:MAG TPA: nuclear transport factor 2 family protein [Candidatus Binataceae bacterium]|nr:nuclear transport factor 2 family protein [Candidatus Binataceae bacterium]
MASIDQIVTELADRDAIRELPQRYCDCVWRGDVEGIVNLFTDDGEFTILGGQRENKTVGRPNLLKSYKEGLANLNPRPYIHNHVIELKGNGRASGRCYVELRTAADNMNWIGTGFYHDEYAKVGDVWKFHSRRFQQVHMENRPAPKAPAQH